MHISRLLFRTTLFLVPSTILVTAGPGGYLELANLTPYDWKLKYTHSYHMDWQFPSTIPARTTQEQYFEWWYDHGPNGDCGAEATYELVGSPAPASFTVQARQRKGRRIEIQYGDQLSSLGNPVGSLITLGYTHDGTVLFVLAGNETGSYVSSNPPVAWMQATLPTIGSKSLREIAMPAGHDAGMSQVTRAYGGIAHNTQTQSVHVYQQLIYGARWLDIRPVIRKGRWYTNHLTGSIGAFGRTIADIIKDINRFTKENPGELIVLDLTHEMDRKNWKPRLTPAQWKMLYDLLYYGLDDFWTIDQMDLPDDLSSVPIETFVQAGSKSAVLVRVPDHAPAFKTTFQNKDMTGDEKPGPNENSNTATDEPLDINSPSTFPGNSTLDGSGDDDDDDDDTPESIPDTINSNSTSTTLPSLPSPKTSKTFTPAFIPAHRLPTVGSYSNTDQPTYLENDQLTKLSLYRPSPQSPIHQSTWTITQHLAHIPDFANPSTSIIGDAVAAHRKLFSAIWKGLSSKTYPNLIEVDDIHDNQIAALLKTRSVEDTPRQQAERNGTAYAKFERTDA
ncbi:hypothetical protein BKA65DRAFT_524083 [Rhexocercosporidium sp. MPI-PUGE-AT-0058]|nr:hypothetical protein BKA65DRAFT_524083 [Rhexocercosporidium sp. MPI-PUGE-AT-0058]